MEENMNTTQQPQGDAGGPAPMGMTPQEEKKGNVGMIIAAIVILIVVIGAGVWLWKKAPSYAPELPVNTGNTTPSPVSADQDTTMEINESLDSVDLGDIDSEFQAIDTDLQGL